ncbi:MAG: chemotaxis protein CheW [Methanoculleaceae archaeon]
MRDILEFALGGNRYALDIEYVREVVEAMPLTVIPRSPRHIAGMTNIRGEIITLVSIGKIIGAASAGDKSRKKFIIFLPSKTRGDNIGIIVDEVYSVKTVSDADIEWIENGGSAGREKFICGIIRQRGSGDHSEEETASAGRSLVIYLDIARLIAHLYDISQ